MSGFGQGMGLEQGQRLSRAWACLSLLGVLLAACSGDPLRSAPIVVDVTRVAARTAAVLPVASPAPLPSATPTTPPPTRTPAATGTLSPTALPLPPGTGPLTVPRIEMDIAVNLPDRRLTVVQTVWTTNHSPDVWEEVVFAVEPAHRQDTFVLEDVTVTTAAVVDAPAGYRLDQTMLHVRLPAPVGPGEGVAVSLAYTMRVPPVTLETWLPEGNLGAGERILQAGDWHPALVPYRDGIGWQTWTYHGVGDPTIYEIADYDVRISTSPGTLIAAAGTQEEGSPNRYTLSRARCFAFLASPDYHVIKADAAGVPLRVYYLPENAEGAHAMVEAAAQSIALFTDLYGPYPTGGLIIAENAYYGSMEYSGLISMSGWAMAAYNGSPESLLISLTAHEIAHQWWYGAVGNDQVHAPWLDESLAKYSEVLFYERYGPEAVPSWWRNHIYRYHPEGPLDRSIYAFDTTSVYIQQIYGQGARFMEELRTLVGDEAFFAFLKAYRTYGEGRLVTASDFFAILEMHTTQDLNPLVQRYFDVSPLAPD